MREEILRRLKQQPFQPFRLKLSNGNVHDVRHPELLLVSPYDVLLGSPSAGLPSRAIDDVISMAMIHIAEIEPMSSANQQTAQ